jgi:hypothetical protein
LYATYGCLLDDIIEFASMIFEQLLADESVIDQYPLGLDFAKWLRKPESTPDSDYLLSAPVSFPLIALGQLANFYIACKIWGLTPGDVIESLQGSTGHSQGIIVAAGLATCRTWDDFEGTFRACLIALFYTGCRSQQQFPHKTSWQKMVQDDTDPAEEPTPMMNIKHLPRVGKTSQSIQSASSARSACFHCASQRSCQHRMRWTARVAQELCFMARGCKEDSTEDQTAQWQDTRNKLLAHQCAIPHLLFGYVNLQ